MGRDGIRLPGPGEGIWSEPLPEYGPEPEAPPARALDGALAMAKEAREAARIGRAAARATVTLAERLAAFEQDPARDAGDLLPDFEAAAAQLHREQGQSFEGLAKQVYDTRMAETVERSRQRAEQATLRKTIAQNRALLDETLTDLGRLAVEGGPEDRDHYTRQAEAAIRAQLAGGIIDEAGAKAARGRFETARFPGLRRRALHSVSDMSAGSARDVDQSEGAEEQEIAQDKGSRGAEVAEANMAKPHFSVTRGGVLVLVDPITGEPVLAPDGKPFALTERRVNELLELGKQTAEKNLREMNDKEIEDIRRFLTVLNDAYLTEGERPLEKPEWLKSVRQRKNRKRGRGRIGGPNRRPRPASPDEPNLWNRLKQAFEEAGQFLNDVPPLDPPNIPPPPLPLPGGMRVPGGFR